jgi:UDP-sulfoquinovose synthase
MRILVLGADGYLGWPTAMNLSAKGHQVAIVDNYLHRRITREEDVESLWEVPNLPARIRLWKEISGIQLEAYIGDLTEWEFVAHIFNQFCPETVIHYAEQPSAPYSMLNRKAAILTLHNNLGVTTNIIFAVREFCPKAHIIKLGTMGEYGTPNIDIEEGWINIKHNNRLDKFLYPRQAGSLYHTTKIMDTDLLWYYVRIWDLHVTDLMQGPVYGIFTEEARQDERLLSFFNYDELFGTVINRFVVQAVAGYPLTVYGKGGQTRGYLNIIDTLSCVQLCVENPPKTGGLRIFNQFTETFSVNELAYKVEQVGNLLGLNVKVQHIENPRYEKEEHYYNPKHTGLISLGLNPHFLSDKILAEMMEYVIKYKQNIEQHKIFKGVKWT